MPVKISVNNEFEFSLCPSDVENLVLVKTAAQKFLMRHESINYHIDVKQGKESKKFYLELDGHMYHIEILDELDQLIDTLGYSEIISKVSGEIKSPMPGNVLEILIKEGNSIKKGDPMIILEAMKMENVLRSKVNGKVVETHVKDKDNVNKGDLLISIDTE